MGHLGPVKSHVRESRVADSGPQVKPVRAVRPCLRRAMASVSSPFSGSQVPCVPWVPPESGQRRAWPCPLPTSSLVPLSPDSGATAGVRPTLCNYRFLAARVLAGLARVWYALSGRDGGGAGTQGAALRWRSGRWPWAILGTPRWGWGGAGPCRMPRRAGRGESQSPRCGSRTAWFDRRGRPSLR